MKVTRWFGKAAAFGTLAGVSALTLGACTGGGTPGAGAPAPAPPASTTAPAPAAPATTAPPPPPAPSVPAAPVTTSYDAARVEWQGGATAISADQGKFWSNAVTDLTQGEATDSDATGYPAAVTRLKELISLPDGQQSPAQNAAYHSDLDFLNGFFKTPGLYS